MAETKRIGTGPRDDEGQLSRRQLLGAGGAALGGALLAPRSAWAANRSQRKVRMGVVGGRMGSNFHWHVHPDAEVTAVADIIPDRRQHLMQRYQCETAYETLEELVRDRNVDAVAIFTDGPLHTQHTELAMRHDKHVCMAVPACWASLEDAEYLLDTVKTRGLRYMLAETSYYMHFTIAARNLYQDQAFGDLIFCEASYDHPGLEQLFWRNGRRTWRYGVAPMHYPTHTTAHLLSVSGERLTEVTCTGWGDDSPILQNNIWNNPFWVENAAFTTNRGHMFRARIGWRGALTEGETANWVGSRKSFYMSHSAGRGNPTIIERGSVQDQPDDDATAHPQFEQFTHKPYWQTDMLPEALRRQSGHGGSHVFLTHEFISALTEDRDPVTDVYEALAYTVPGIVAHESALRGGEHRKIPQFDPPARAEASRTGDFVPQH